VLIPLEQVYAVDPPSSAAEQTLERTRGIPDDFARQGEAIGNEVLDDIQGNQDTLEEIIGEDIIVQIDDYQPKIIRSSLLEDSGIFVHALISGTPTNPTISIPNIRNIVIRNQKVTTVPQGIPVSVGRITHISPPNKELTYDNMGTLVIPIRQIPQEGKVPDEIIVDIDARIFFEVSEGLFFGPVKDILTEQSLDAWKLTKEDHSFYAGYVHATEIKDNKASFMLYDNQLNELTRSPITLTVGQTSRTLNANRAGYMSYGRLFDKYTLKLNSVKGIGDKVRLLINKEGESSSVYLTEGEDLYVGSPWFVENIVTNVKGTSLDVTLRNKITREGTVLQAIKTEVIKPEEIQEKIPITTTDPQEAVIQEKLKTLIKEYYEIEKKEDAKKITEYQALLKTIQSDFLTQNLSSPVKIQVTNVAKSIHNYYIQKSIETEAALNLETNTVRRQVLENTKTSLSAPLQEAESLVKQIEKVGGEPSPLQASNDPIMLQRLAIAEYEKVINNYPKVRTKTAEAHWKIANLALFPGINDYQTATTHLEILMQNYEQAEYAPVRKKDIQDLLTLLKTRTPNFHSVVTELRETASGKVIYVTLLGAQEVPDNLKSKATLEVEGSPSKEYREGEQLLQADTDQLKWFVKEIRDNEIILVEDKSKKQESLSRNQQKSLETGKDQKRNIRLIKTDTKKEASITISPNTEAAFSEAVFSLHLPIEKRALDLPLFSDSFDEEIAKTEDLLAKLDKIVENVGTVTEYWKKFCFITFAVVWVKNFFQGLGGTGPLARERTNEAFEKKYDEYRNLEGTNSKSCRNLSYDECVFKNQAEYNNMNTAAATAISEVNKGNYQKPFELGSEYQDVQKDLGYYENLVKSDPDNQAYRDKYYELHARLQRAKEEKEFTQKYFVQNEGRPKTYDEVGDIEAKKILDAHRTDILAKFKPTVTDDRALWRSYSEQFLPLEREKQINERMTTYLTGAQDKLKPVLGQTPRQQSDKNNDASFIEELKQSYGVTTVTELGDFKHNPKVATLEQGRQKGYAEFVSIDARHYLQVTYTTGGRPSKYDLYRRTQPNGIMGGPSDVYLGVADGQLLDRYNKIKKEDTNNPDGKIYDAIKKGQECIGTINKKNAGGRYGRGEVIPMQAIDCGGLGSYAIENSAAATGPSCTQFMSPSDCSLLFNACDPVICPPSRCNLGGEWPVDNVIQTGLIGSAVLCLPNFGIEPLGIGKPGGVAMPICLSGIYAGLQNIRSVIEGYRQCLITAKVSGRSVGICDRIRSYGICEILWKEGMAIFNAKNGIFRNIVNFFLGKSNNGGGEYSAFENAVDNSIGGLQYFTQSYAKNAFALYDGGALPEIGTEICKAAIFGKAPGIGNLFDQISRPESPPQFTAFFDEAPYSDLGNQPLSQYKVTYHLYAGDNEDIMYTVYMQAADPYTGQFVIQPHVLKDSKGIISNRRLPRGTFASESPDLILPSGMKEICIDINSRIYGRKVECGFGKVSTSFGLNYVTDQLTQNEAKKQISSAEQCVPTSSPTITELGMQGALGTVSSGFIETGIIRKCSKFNPGVGGDESKWSPVGTCGEDDRERDLGTCWLYIPAAQNAIKQTTARLDLNTSLARTADEVIKQAEEQDKPIPGYTRLNATTIQQKRSEAKKFIAMKDFEKARDIYQEILNNILVEEDMGANVQFDMAYSYELQSFYLVSQIQQTPVSAPSCTPGKSCPKIEKIDKVKVVVNVEEVVTITGVGLKGTAVKYDGAFRPVITTATDTQVQLKIPKNTPLGKYKIVLTNIDDDTTSNEVFIEVVNPTTPQATVQPVTLSVCKVQGWFGVQQYWGDEKGNKLPILEKKDGDMVSIHLTTENCKKEEVIVKLFEDDLINDDYISTIPQRDMSLINNHLQIPWKVVYKSNTYLGISLVDAKVIVAVYLKSEPSKAIFIGKQQLIVRDAI